MARGLVPYLRELKRIRESRFLSQRELAERSGIALSTLNRIEVGRVDARYSTARKLAAALSVEPAELVGEVEPRQ